MTRRSLKAVFVAGSCIASIAHAAPPSDAEVSARAKALIAQMTPDEKAGQLSQYFYIAQFPSLAKAVDDDIAHGRAQFWMSGIRVAKVLPQSAICCSATRKLNLTVDGTAILSFSDGVTTRDGDVFEIEADAFSLPVRNPLVRAQGDVPVKVRTL